MNVPGSCEIVLSLLCCVTEDLSLSAIKIGNGHENPGCFRARCLYYHGEPDRPCTRQDLYRANMFFDCRDLVAAFHGQRGQYGPWTLIGSWVFLVILFVANAFSCYMGYIPVSRLARCKLGRKHIPDFITFSDGALQKNCNLLRCFSTRSIAVSSFGRCRHGLYVSK